MPNITSIPQYKQRLLDPKTGLCDPVWYRYFQNLFGLLGQGGNQTSLEEVQLGPGGGPVGGTGLSPPSPQYAYGAFLSTASQFAPVVNTAYSIEYDTITSQDGVRAESWETSFTASSATTTLTVTSMDSGTIYPGMVLSGGAVAPGTRVTQQLSGTTGFTGTYEIDTVQTWGFQSVSGTITSRLRVYRPGTYQLTIRLGVVNTDTATHQIDIWLRQNGSDVVASNTKVTAQVNDGIVDGYTPTTVVFGVSAAQGDSFDVMWSTTDLSTTLDALAAQTSPTRPLTPSVMVTAQMMSVPTVQGVAA